MLKQDKIAPPTAAFRDKTDEKTCEDEALPAFSGPNAEEEEEEVAVVIATIREHLERKR